MRSCLHLILQWEIWQILQWTLMFVCAWLHLFHALFSNTLLLAGRAPLRMQ